MNWKKSPPTKLGWYFWRAANDPEALFTVKAVEDCVNKKPLYIDGGNSSPVPAEEFQADAAGGVEWDHDAFFVVATDGWVGDIYGPDAVAKIVGHLIAAIWPMPYDNYWILLCHDFGREKTTVRHYESPERAKEVAEEWLTKL